ncbi:MAG TPA: helix-turn-helix domain-containing protein [Solirubrobacteraceae bacterium]
MSVCHILREDPELAEAVPWPERRRAVEDCIARIERLSRGQWSAQGGAVVSDGIGLLVLDGLLLRRVGIDGRYGAELLGEGDLLRPWQRDDTTAALARSTGWRVLEPTRLAVLDEAVARRLAVYPKLIGRLVGRAIDRSRHLAVNMAIIHQARVNVRLHMMLWHLAERWGRVGSEGVLLPLALTHAVLSDLVAARRPTVTTALAELYRQELVRDLPRGWLLLGEPPGELLVAQGAGIAES